MRAATVLCAALCLSAAAAPAGEDRPSPAAPKAAPTAWGKPVGGVQLGIRARSGVSAPGTVLELAVVVRNVGPKDAEVWEPLGLYFRGESDGGTVAARPAFDYGGFAQPGAYFVATLGPGKEYALSGGLRVVRPSAGRQLTISTELAPGAYRVGVDRFELRVGERMVELGTGYLDVEIPPEKK